MANKLIIIFCDLLFVRLESRECVSEVEICMRRWRGKSEKETISSVSLK